MIRIRKCRRGDAREVAALISKTFSQFCGVEGTEVAVEEYVEHYDPNGKTDEEVEGLFSRTPTRLAAIADSHTVGVLRARDNRIINLFVRGDYHRQGIATRLVRRFEKACVEAGFTEVVLRSSLCAIPFYEAMGYKKTTGVRNLRGLKVQPMKKKLKMKTSKPADIVELESIPNVGPAIAAKLRLLGFASPSELAGQDPYEMYRNLCEQTRKRHDPCLLDVFISAVSFADGEPPKPWWKFTGQRKAELKRRA